MWEIDKGKSKVFGPSNVAPWPPHLTEPSREPKSWSGSAYPHPKEHHTMVNWRTVIFRELKTIAPIWDSSRRCGSLPQEYIHASYHRTLLWLVRSLACCSGQVTAQRTALLLWAFCILSRGKPLRFNARNYMKQNCNIPKSPCGHFKHRIGGQWFFYALSLLLSHFMDIIEECVKSGTESIFSINRG